MLPIELLKSLNIEPSQEYIRLCEFGLQGLEPWEWISCEDLEFRLNGLRERYPGRNLVPFAERQDRDDVACWDKDMPGLVVVIHDYSSKGLEQRARFASFREWMHQSLDDCMDFI